MLIVAIAYVYVVAILAIAYMVNGKVIMGGILLVFGCVLPMALWLWLVSRRQRAKVARFEEEQARAAANAGEQTTADDVAKPS
jgi:extradiol dioxygenase family protein